MVKALSFVILGIVATVGSAAPSCSTRQSIDQWISSRPQSLSSYENVLDHSNIRGTSNRVHRRPSGPAGSDNKETLAIVYLPHNKRRTRPDLDAIMQALIDKKLTFDYDAKAYHANLVESICNDPSSYYQITDCKITILSEPKIQVIPTQRLSDNIICKTSSCKVAHDDAVSVWTTHSDETTLPIRVGGEPFQVSVDLHRSLGYGFSNSVQALAPIYYQLDLVEGDEGYIAMVSAEISAKIRVTGCKRYRDDVRRGSSNFGCSTFIDQTGHNEVVITQNGYDPKAIIAFISA
ncbi:hypothetical protein BGX30_015286 [Mortierella sp. GBA39]|nr:hypothetical protein BGX30_015286 [Mortierella sp. GBA39]